MSNICLRARGEKIRRSRQSLLASNSILLGVIVRSPVSCYVLDALVSAPFGARHLRFLYHAPSCNSIF